MSILLTDDEVSILLHENTFLTDGDFARAIQLALIEKIRAEPVAWIKSYAMTNEEGLWDKVEELSLVDNLGCPLFTIPTAQELENER